MGFPHRACEGSAVSWKKEPGVDAGTGTVLVLPRKAVKGHMDSVRNCKLSVIIPSKDHEEVLKRCIRSVAAEAGRGQGIDFEIIVVDNGSKADTRQEMERWLGAQGVALRIYIKKCRSTFLKCVIWAQKRQKGKCCCF